MNHGLLPRDLDEIIAILKGFPEIEQAVVFGSRAKGTYKPGSDVDIAIKGASISPACVSALSSLLNEESVLPYFFDIVHFERLTERALIEHIDRVGFPLYIREVNTLPPSACS